MKTLIVILIPISKSEKIVEIKNQIVKYLGSRMVEQNLDDIAELIVNQTLDNNDKTTIANAVANYDDRGCVMFLETEKDTIPDNLYCTFKL